MSASAIYYREALLETDEDDDDLDLDRGRARLSFSSELPVLRAPDSNCDTQYWEVLSHRPGDANFRWLNHGGVVLMDHEPVQVIGSVERGSARVDGDRKARATIQLDPEYHAYLRKIADGRAPNSVSVGYSRLSVVSRGPPIDGKPVLRFSFLPNEVSLLTGQAADPHVGISRSKSKPVFMNEENDNDLEHQPEGTPLNRRERRALAGEDKRVKEIQALTRAIGPDNPQLQGHLQRLSAAAILSQESADTFRAKTLALLDQRSAPQYDRMIVEDGPIGMSQGEIESYSLLNVIQSQIPGNAPLGGVEREAHLACEKKYGRAAEGKWVPPDIRVRTSRFGKRDLQVGVFSLGGATVGTDIMPIIELLRNSMVCQRLGIMEWSGLSSNAAVPRQTAAATAYALPEIAQLPLSDQAIDQLPLVPHRVGSSSRYSKQLLVQSSIDVENFVRADLMTQLAIKWDYLVLQGAGSASEPLGIMNTPGIGSVVFGGPVSWPSVISFETALAVANALVDGKAAFVTTPQVRAKLKQVAKIGSTFPNFIWETADYNDDSGDGRINGYRAAVTNSILNNAMMFGRFSDVVLGLFGGYDIVVDPYTLARNAEVQVTINSFGDVVLRHAASFVWSADSGSQ